MNAEGKRTNANCKPVICIDTGEVYTSVADCAEKNNVTQGAISLVCLGKSKYSKGKRYCFVSDMPEYYEEIAQHIREMYPAYMVYQAQQREEARIAEERKQEEKRLAEEEKRIAKTKDNYAKQVEKYNKALNRVKNAREELLALGVTM